MPICCSTLPSLAGAPVSVMCTCTPSAVNVAAAGLSAAKLAALVLSRGCMLAGGRKLSGCLPWLPNAAAHAAPVWLLLLLLLLQQ